MTNKFIIPQDIELEAQTYIQNVVNELANSELYKEIDDAALTMLARNYSMFITASKQLAREGMTIVNAQDNVVTHPAIKIAKDAQSAATTLMKEFGLTAKSRTKLPVREKEDDSPFMQFVGTNKK